MKCIICRKPIDVQKTWTKGHNALPVNEGRCCTNCNEKTVIPARQVLKEIDLIQRGSKKDRENFLTYILSDTNYN